jgi:hypothetical protein
MRHIRRGWVPAGLAAAVVLLLVACDPVTITQRALYTTQASVTISGSVTARDGDPLTSVTVNGVSATLDGTNYSAVVPVNGGPTFVPVLVVAHFTSGQSEIQRSTVAFANDSTVTLVPNGGSLANGLATQLTASAIGKIGPTLSSSVNFPTSDFAIPPADLGGDIFDIQITGNTTTINPAPTVALDLATGTLRATETYSNLHQLVSVQVQGFTGPQTCTLDVAFAPLTATTTYNLAPNATTGLTATLAAAPTATSTPSASGCQASNVLASSVPTVLADVQSATQTELIAALSDPDGSGPNEAPLAAALEASLHGVVLSGPIGGASSGVTLTAPVSSITPGTTGIGTVNGAAYASSSVATGAQAQSSSLAFGSTTAAPSGSGTFDWSVAMTTGSVNQALAAETERGQLNRATSTVAGQALTYNALNTLVGLGGPISPDRPVRLVVGPELAPALTAAPGSGSSVGVVHLGGLRLTVSFSDSTGGTIVDSVIDADGTASLVLSSGSVALRATGFTTTRQDVFDNPSSFSAAQITGITNVLMGDALAPLGTGLPVLNAPAVSGLGLSATSTFRSGSMLGMLGSY